MFKRLTQKQIDTLVWLAASKSIIHDFRSKTCIPDEMTRKKLRSKRKKK